MPGPGRLLSVADRRRHLARRGVRLARRYRRLVGVVLLALGGWLTLTLVTSPGPPTTTVAVAARDLGPGVVLTSRDVAAADIPVSLAPAGALAPSDVVGHSMGAARASGEMLTRTALVGSDLLTGAPEGRVALPVPLLDAGTGAVLQPGDVVDLMTAVPTATGAEVRVAASRAVVLRGLAPAPGGTGVTDAPAAAGALAAPFSASTSRAAVVVAVTPDEARDVVAGAVEGSLWAAVHPRP